MATLLAMHDFESEFVKAEPASGPMRRPRSLDEIDLPPTVLDDLALKVLYVNGSLSTSELSKKLCLSFNLAEELFSRMRTGLFCQVVGMLGSVTQISITSQGRARACELLAQNSYVGAAPVSLASYTNQTRKQSVQKVEVHAADVRRAFSHLVIDNETMSRFGTALNSGNAVFLYGPAGTGKTTIAEALSSVLAEDEVWIPRAVEVDGQIIVVYDPSVHRQSKEEPEDYDTRWVLCQRPSVMVGGELTAEMLDMQFNPVTKYYIAPAQMKANNGVFIIDDFGRQRIRPEDLLNRWIVPLDRRIDYLTLAGGKKAEVPFEMLVVFASNKNLEELVDESFLRRIQTKIRIGEVSDAQFCEIFRRVALDKQVRYDPDIPNQLIEFVHHVMHHELRSCYPRDIVNQECWAARYDGREPYLDQPALQRAIQAYFPV